MKRMCHWNPIYMTSICKRCNLEIETSGHLIKCSKNNDEVFNNIAEELVSTLGNLLPFQKSAIVNLLVTDNLFLKEELMLNSEFIRKLHLILENEQKLSSTIRRLSQSIYPIFRKYVWIKRCEETSNWAKDRSNNHEIATYYRGRNTHEIETEEVRFDHERLSKYLRDIFLRKHSNAQYIEMEVQDRLKDIVNVGHFCFQ